MNASTISSVKSKTPWHLWVVGILTLLWDGAGAYTIMMAQAGRLPDLRPDEIAYYGAQPLWFVVATDVALLGAIAAGVALLLRSRVAVGLFGVSLVAIFVTNIYDLAMGTSRVFATQGALVATCVIVVLAILQFAYALAMRRRVVLS